MGGYNSGVFTSIELATDSTYFVTGRFGLYKKNFDGSLDELNAATFFMHLDKFGNLIWLKRVSSYISSLHISNIFRVSSNSFILSGSLFTAGHNNLVLMKTNLSGNVGWYRVMYAENTVMYNPYVTKLNNGDVLLAGGTVKTDPDTYLSTNQGYYCFRVDPATGDIISSKGFYFNGTATSEYYPFDNIRKVFELPNDTLLFCSSFSERERFTAFPGVKEGLLIKAGSNGDFYKADAYYNNTRAGTQLIDVLKNTDGSFSLLMDDGYETLHARIANGGQLLSQQGYGLVNGNLKGLKLLDRQPANRILFGGRTQVGLLGLMKTEADGSINCMETGSQITSKSVSSFFSTGNISMSTVNTSAALSFEDFSGGIGRFNYTFDPITDCFQSCCENIDTDTSFTEVCNALNYKLPDNTIVNESGIYYIHYITENGCDSTAFFDIRFAKKPIADLGEDLCLGDSTRILIKADSGYYDYNWMGTSSGNHTYVVTQPGKYRVIITNSCGSSTDEIEVFRECDFDVYIPTAFTPNNDGLNDVFGYPGLNKNKFINMTIYNRWGQRIFYSTDANKGWDGKYKGMEQPTDIYVFLFELESLNGKKIMKKGVFQLIR